MAALTERFEVRMDPDSLQRLREEAQHRGVSVGEAVRLAVASWLEDDRQARIEAAKRLFLIDAPVADWETMKAEIEEGYGSLP